MVGRAWGRVRVTVVAVVVMAAVTGSQAPGRVAGGGTEVAGPPVGPGDSVYLSELPPLAVRGQVPGSAVRAVVVADRAALPATVFAAYRRAEEALARSTPHCRLRWQLLAAIGQVESGQARGGRVDADGTTYAPIIGPQLNGRGFALIRDTDGGAHDGDAAYDHAVGPMQFIPSTWARWGSDGNGDGRADPHNVHDAALAAGRYLCAGGRDLARPGDLHRAILSYNRSHAYLSVVLAWYAYFRDGHRVVPDPGGTHSSAEAARRPAAPPEPASRAAEQPAQPAQPAPSPRPSRSAEPSPAPSPRPTTSPRPQPLPSLVTAPEPGVELSDAPLIPGTAPLPGNG
ncbi:lytic transglycosylase domain-containing protein [Streptomyces tritici]|uniref:lytic transglycosylase domain-containing protein n=1 Tax=Streptomyces tritici TaxID=2054410 RepID=UPI003AF1204A